jgi:heat shock protein HslJ
VVFALPKTVNMKKTIFVLPLCALLTFCSRKTVAPAPAGISNVNVGRGDSMTSAAKASAGFTTADRDWAYKAKRDTSLNGTWTLTGIMANDGTWGSTEVIDTTSMATTATTDTAMSAETTATTTTTGGKSTSKRARTKNRNALYTAAQTRLKLDYKAGSAIDTTALEPYKYWTRTPTLSINAARAVFTGNTGCNSMSGTFNFSEKDIQFGRNIVTSKMACNEYDESVFLSALKKADNYTINGDILEIRQGNTKLLSFRKS